MEESHTGLEPPNLYWVNTILRKKEEWLMFYSDFLEKSVEQI